MSNPADPPVVVRYRWWVRVVGLVVGTLFGFAAWASVVAMWITGFDANIVFRVLMGALLLLIALLCTNMVVTFSMMKMTYSSEEITVRTVVRTRHIAFADATAIRQVKASVHTGVRQIPIGRLQVLGDPAQGLRGTPTRAAIDDTLTHWRDAMTVLDEWVRRRPDLVSADQPARQVFTQRGVPLPTATPSTAPPPTGTPPA